MDEHRGLSCISVRFVTDPGDMVEHPALCTATGQSASGVTTVGPFSYPDLVARPSDQYQPDLANVILSKPPGPRISRGLQPEPPASPPHWNGCYGQCAPGEFGKST